MKADRSIAKAALVPAIAACIALSGCATAAVSSNNSKARTEQAESKKKQEVKKGSKKTTKRTKTDSEARKTASAKDKPATAKKRKTLLQRLFPGASKRSAPDDESVTGSTKKTSKAKPQKNKKVARAEQKKVEKKAVENAEAQAASLKQLASTIDARGPVTRTGEVYLFRGLANIFSRGMDQMGRKMVNKGLDARVYNHSRWRYVANNILARDKRGMVSYPIVIMGHSLGANASTQMAKYLGDRGVKVTYVVAFDPTITTYVGQNIKQVTNYYLPNSDADNIVVKKDGFNGRLRNVNMAHKHIGHLNIEKNRKLQNDSINRILDVTRPLPKSRRKK